MSSKDIITQIESIAKEITIILTLLNSRRTGTVSYRPSNIGIPEITLSSGEKNQIFTTLQQMGQPIQQIISDSRKIFDDHETNELTQDLIDHHAASLDLITSIQQNQLDPSDYGMMIASMTGFNNAILNLQKRIIVLGSYSTSKNKVNSSSSTKPIDIKKVISIILGIIALVGGLAGYAFIVNIDENTIIDSNPNTIVNSPGSEIETGPDIDVQDSPNTQINISPEIDITGNTTININPLQETHGLSFEIIPYLDELKTKTYPAIIFPNGTVIHKEGEIASSGLVIYENKTAKFSIFVYNSGPEIAKLENYVIKIVSDDNTKQPVMIDYNFDDIIIVPGSDPHEIPVEFTVKSKMQPSGIIKFELHHSKGTLESNPLNYEYYEKSPFD